MTSLKRCPINYMGGKFNSLKYMRKHFPSNIDIFYDVFTGSGTVPLNIPAAKYVLNDSLPQLISLHDYLISTGYDEVFQNIIEDVKEFDLNCLTGEGYYRLRDLYNERNEARLLFALITHSFNYIMRFNRLGKFNTSFGKGKCKLGGNMLVKLKGYTDTFNLGNTQTVNKDFREFIKTNTFKENDFVYFDPPYEQTVAIYNENGNWGVKDAIEVLNIIKELDGKGVRFGYSNTLESKGIKNTLLLDFINDNPNFKVIYNNGHIYGVPSTRIHRGKDVEVYITNDKGAE